MVFTMTIPAWSRDTLVPTTGDEVFGEVEFRLDFHTLNRLSPNKNDRKRTVEVKVVRKDREEGLLSFSAPCTISGKLTEDKLQQDVSCTLVTESVSNDDDEELSFTIRETANRRSLDITTELRSVTYVGDLTGLGEELTVLFQNLTEDTFDSIPESTLLENTSTTSDDPEKNPLALAAYISKSLTPLLEKKVYSRELDAEILVKSVNYFVSDRLDVRLTLNLTYDGRVSVDLPKSVSLFEEPQKWGGLVSQEELLRRVEKQLRKLLTQQK